MGGCFGKSNVHPENEQVGPIENRKCRDVFFLLLFIVYLIGMFIITWKAVSTGDINRLTYGTDSFGNICGTDNTKGLNKPKQLATDLTHYPYLYWPDPLNSQYQLCVKECPSKFSTGPVCVYGFDDFSHCTYFTYPTKPVLHRCFPKDPSYNGTNNIYKELNARSAATQVFADILHAAYFIAAAAAIALVLGFIWLVLMRYFSGIVVWLTILLVYILVIGFTIFLIWKGIANVLISLTLKGHELKKELSDTPVQQRLDSDIRNQRVVEAFGYIFIVVSVVLLILLVWMRNRIALAIGIIKESAKALASMPFIVFFPAFTFLCIGAFTVYWLVIAFYLSSAGKSNYDSLTKEFKGYSPDNVIRGMEVYHFFGYLWVTQFFVAICQTTIAGAVASWYWALDRKSLPTFPVLSSFLRVLRYHLGSMALGSLIIAIVKFIRAVLAWLQRKLKGAQFAPLVILLKCLSCCFALYERFLKVINKNAYIMVCFNLVMSLLLKIAIKGESFCTSAGRGFALLLSNILRVGTVSVISSFLLFMGKLWICMGTTFLSYYVLSRNGSIEFVAIPVIVIALISYFIASSFMNVFDMTIDTILLSFCEDVERNNGNDKPYAMPESLKKFIESSHTFKCFGCC